MLYGLIILWIIFFGSGFYGCSPPDSGIVYTDQIGYLNLNDTVEYMGMHVCKECHFNIYSTFCRTGMGLSFDTASKEKSAAVIREDSILYDSSSNFYYKPFWDGDTLRVKEYRTENDLDIHSRTEKVNYIIGSGQHTNSHIYLSGGYAYQIPFTYYTQDSRFDFPPGFDEGNNSRFSRKIGLECMACHNGYPDFVLGSENKYTFIADGIDCERCHGPGEVHVKLKKSGYIIDTSKYIDYSIVNPANLSPKLQIDVCARCHLQGTMVLKPNKNFYSFKPGQLLTESMDIFMPLLEGGEEDLIMASHYERLSQSDCYVNSNEQFSCINCHNPHITVKETNQERYDKFCFECHYSGNSDCSLLLAKRMENDNKCVSCHMRLTTSRDIPHVKIHDHKISIPPTKKELNSERIFKGMVPVSNLKTDSLTIARGYLLEYETYHADPNYLDSAFHYLSIAKITDSNYYFNAWINLYFLSGNYKGIINYIEKEGVTKILNKYLTTQDYSNYDGWTSYRIGQAYDAEGNQLIAKFFYENAVKLAPYNLEFQNKYGALLVKSNKLDEAKQVFEFIISEDPRYTRAYVNLGYTMMQMNNRIKGKAYFEKALSLNPDNLQALINMAGLMILEGNVEDASNFARRAYTIEPNNPQVIPIREKIGEMNN